MSKLSLSTIALAVGLALGASGSAVAGIVIDFESTALGTYSSLIYGPLSISFTAGDGKFQVDNASPGSPISNHNLISYFTNPGPGHFRATITGGASMFQIGVGDFDQDEDHAHLRAYDAIGNLLASADYINPAAKFGGDFLTVSSAIPIAYVDFYEDSAGFPGAVYWDNISYDLVSKVPEPGSLSLAALALSIGGFVRRRDRARAPSKVVGAA